MKKTAAGFPDDWFNSNLRKQIEDTSKAFSLINLSAVQDIVRATTAFTAFQQEIRKQTEALGLGFQQHFTQQAETIARLQDGLKMPLLFARETQLLGTLMSEALKSHEQVFRELQSAAKLASTQWLALANNGTLDAFRDARLSPSALSAVWEYIPKEGEEPTETEIEEDVRGFEEFLYRFLAKLPHFSSDDFVKVIIIPLIMGYFYLYIGSIQSARDNQELRTTVITQGEENRKAVAALGKSVSGVIERLDSPKASNEKRTALIATTKTRVRQTPKSDSEIVGIIYVGQAVELIEDRGKRIKLRYADLQAGEEREGWVLKKYMTRGRAK